MDCPACGSSSLVEGKIVTDGDLSFRPSGDSKLKRAFGIGRRPIRAYACPRCSHLQFAVDFSEDDLREYRRFKGEQQRSAVEHYVRQDTAGARPMIAFHDFIPRRQGRRLLGMVTDYENLHELVSRVNRWIEEHHIDVLNVETVLVTSLPKETEASPKVEMASPANVMSTIQIVRVWYRQTSEAERAYTGETTRLSSD
jgi:hypothetical protein